MAEYDLILMFNMSTGSDRIYYFMMDPRSKDKMFPKMNTTIFPKLRNLVGYRPVVLGGNLYIIGGKDWATGYCAGHTWKYNPQTGKWTACASQKEPRCRFSADVLDGRIYVTGGEISTGQVTDQVESYDPGTDTWTVSKAMPRPRVDHASCASGHRLYISGGISNLKHQCSDVFWAYDVLTNQWTEPCPDIQLPDERDRHIMVPHKPDLIYVLSGRGFDQDVFMEKDEAHVYSYTTKYDGTGRRNRPWDIDHPHMVHPRVSCGYITLGSFIYVFGGKSYQNDKEILDVDYYHVNKRKWRTCFTLPPGYSYANLDCVKLTVSTSNRDFCFGDVHLYDKWIMW